MKINEKEPILEKQEFLVRLGKLLKEARERKSLTLRQAAEMVGVTYESIRNWETAKRSIEVTNLVKIMHILDIDISVLNYIAHYEKL